MSEEEIKTLTGLLAKLEPGFLPYSIFNEITRVFVSSIVEVVPLRQLNDKIQVLLVRREADDPFWPNMRHTPGTVLRAIDQKGNLKDAFTRIINDELGLKEEVMPVFVDVRFSQSTRGSEFSAIYYVEMTEEIIKGEWFDVETLPDDIVQSQRELVAKVVESFKK